MLLTVSMAERTGNAGTIDLSRDAPRRVPVVPRSGDLKPEPVLPPLNSHLLHDGDPPVAHGDNARGRRGPVVVPSQRDRRRQAIRIPVLQRLDGRSDCRPTEAKT